jgi:undecaprenyl-diphosphatase
VAGTRVLPGGSSDERTTTWWQVTAVGLVQGLTVLPGLSRSGFTIAASLGVGLDRAWAARFSFLLSAPVIIAATVTHVALSADELEVIGNGFWIASAVGAVSASVTGYFALKVVVRAVSSEVFHRFAWYCLPLGLAVAAASVVL